jgi:hypothetical protein
VTPLLTSPTRKPFGLLRTLMLLAALGAIALQLVWLFNGKASYATMGLTYYLPAVAAILSFVLFLLLGRGGGEIKVFADRVEGTRSLGVLFNIPMNQISEVQLANGRVALKGKDNELLLVESPSDGRVGGLIWLVKEYGDWDAQIWEQLRVDGQDGFARVTRHFLGEDGEAVFGDHGFMAGSAGQSWYFPETAMFPIVGHDGQPQRIFHRAGATGATLFQIDPSPDQVPLAAFIAALLQVKQANAPWEVQMEVLAENHGGNRCSPGAEGEWEGECLGYRVKLSPYFFPIASSTVS